MLTCHYSPGLALYNFFLFPKIKSMHKGTHLLLIGEEQAKTMELLNSLAENDLHHFFEQC
jgi:hypothetical protein